LGIGDWAQSPIPNPQSPIPNPHLINNLARKYLISKNYSIKNKIIFKNNSAKIILFST
jgi:hypothetical protein